MSWMVSCQRLITQAWIQSQARPCGIFKWQRGTGTGYSLYTLIFHCQHHSTSAPHLHIHSTSTYTTHLSNCKNHYIKKVFTTMRPSHPTHNYIYTYINIYVGVHFATPSPLSMKKRGEGGRHLHFPNFLGYKTLFNLVNIYWTHVPCGPSFIN
jgi:hypothetical protein